MIWDSDPGDDDYPVCQSCDRAHFQVNEDGLCVTCDVILRAQAKTGLDDFQVYLGKVAMFQRYLLGRVAA